jgi:hypothetical protein
MRDMYQPTDVAEDRITHPVILNRSEGSLSV